MEVQFGKGAATKSLSGKPKLPARPTSGSSYLRNSTSSRHATTARTSNGMQGNGTGEVPLTSLKSALDALLQQRRHTPSNHVDNAPRPPPVSSTQQRPLSCSLPQDTITVGIEYMRHRDYSAAKRTFRLCEDTIEAHLAVYQDPDYLSAVKFLLNFGVCCALCDEFSKSFDLFTRAQQLARLLTTSTNGLMVTLLHACTTNMEVLAMISDPTSADARALLIKPSHVLANRFFVFEQFDTSCDTNTAAGSPTEASSVHSKELASSSSSSSRLVTTSSPTAISPATQQQLVQSLLSNSRCLLQLDQSALKNTKLRLIVTREHLVEELGWYMSNMEPQEVCRPLELAVKAETAIDGGYGGVTNDVLDQFFSAVCSSVVHTNQDTDHDTPRDELRKESVTPHACTAFGALLIKCWIEGRSFASLQTFSRVHSWKVFLLSAYPDDHAANEETTRCTSTTPDEVRNAVCLQFLQQTKSAQSDIRLSPMWKDLITLDSMRGSTYHRSLEYFMSAAEENVDEAVSSELESLVPVYIQEVVEEHMRGVTEESPCSRTNLYASAFAWHVVIGCRIPLLIAMRRGMLLMRSLVRDECLGAALFDSRMACISPFGCFHDAVSDSLWNTIGGGSEGISAKSIVSRLDFRGWNHDSRAPYYLCSWLHRKATASEREAFLALCTGMTSIPLALIPPVPASTSNNNDITSETVLMPTMRIAVVRCDSHMYAKTCFYTLYLPGWDECTMEEAWMCLSAAVSCVVSDRRMHEIDV